MTKICQFGYYMNIYNDCLFFICHRISFERVLIAYVFEILINSYTDGCRIVK